MPEMTPDEMKGAWERYWPTRWFQPNDAGLEAHRETFLEALSAHPAEETEELRARIERAREAWWSATEQGDNGLVYTDRIEDAMDEIWNEIGHAEWRPSIGCNICGESLPDAEPHLCRPVPTDGEAAT